MEIPSRHRSPPGGLPSMPSIFIGGSSPPRGRGGFGMSSSRPGFSNFSTPLSTSIPMSIPGSRNFDEPPPPLPPPRLVPIDGPTGDHPPYPEPYTRHNPSISAGSGYGSMDESAKREPQRWPPTKPERDEGYGSLSSMASSSRSQNSIPSRFGLQADRYPWKPSVDAYDNAQLSKLNSHRSLNNRSPTQRPSFGSSLGDSLRHSTTPAPDRLQMLKPLTLPTRTKQQQPMLESPSRFTETPLSSAASPRSTPFTPLDHRSPMEGGVDFERSPVPRPRRTDSMSAADDATVSTQASHEMSADDTDFPMEETTRLRGFHIDTTDHHSMRPKRKASSPPGGDEPYSMTSMSNDMLRRREGGASRGSPTPRLSMMPQGSASGRSGSMISNLSLQVSSLSGQSMFNSAGRRSPGGMSPGGLSPTEQSSCGSPYGTPMSLTASPRSSISRATPHSRTLSDQNRQPMSSPRKLTEVLAKTSTAVSKIKGFYMCECCPKKPKKFVTKEDLSAHELEKQYECSFCGNRFKNKNEAERHQNSLHVRRHSWSCSALSGWDRTFHESTTQPGRADVCGYCGKEFARSGPPGSGSASSGGAAAAGNAWVATEQDWEDRHRHLTDAHKYRECNASKKFYRADHFRQHLKHSHAGTSGKWTNMLENACMIEEEPPVPMGR